VSSTNDARDFDKNRRALVAETARWHDAPQDDAALARTIARLRDGRFVLAVVGEFSSGKSFLLNALLGKVAFEERTGGKRIAGLLATDINPSTATITELAYAPEESATAIYANGREERIPLGRLARFVAVGEEGKLHDATGEMVAFSGVIVDPGQPQWGLQQLTAVVRTHRGHRLGLLVKTAMLELLATAEPQIEWIATGNAAANEHMIAVNEQLSYKVVEPGWRFYEIPVADIR